MRRPDDWLRQAELDLETAKSNFASGHYEWCCFAAQQVAEKAIKAGHQADGTEAWGHSVSLLLEAFDPPDDILDAARRLDRHYIGTRYPTAYAAGAPGDLYTRLDGEQALADCEGILAWARRRLLQA
jgi:HEPN domain-containing protein